MTSKLSDLFSYREEYQSSEDIINSIDELLTNENVSEHDEEVLIIMRELAKTVKIVRM